MENRVQHGDLILTRVPKEKVPADLSWKKVAKGFIVERGEGAHTHVTVDDCEIAEKDGVLYMRDIPGKQFGVDHEEHHVKTLQPDVWRKGIELEYDAEADEARRTQD
jgi:hypothetical protein